MSVPTTKYLSVEEYKKISKSKNLEIEIKNMLHLKPTTMALIMGALGMIKKETDKIARCQTVQAYMKYKKMYFAELLISLGEYCY